MSVQTHFLIRAERVHSHKYHRLGRDHASRRTAHGHGRTSRRYVSSWAAAGGHTAADIWFRSVTIASLVVPLSRPLGNLIIGRVHFLPGFYSVADDRASHPHRLVHLELARDLRRPMRARRSRFLRIIRRRCCSRWSEIQQ